MRNTFFSDTTGALILSFTTESPGVTSVELGWQNARHSPCKKSSEQGKMLRDAIYWLENHKEKKGKLFYCYAQHNQDMWWKLSNLARLFDDLMCNACKSLALCWSSVTHGFHRFYNFLFSMLEVMTNLQIEHVHLKPQPGVWNFTYQFKDV